MTKLKQSGYEILTLGIAIAVIGIIGLIGFAAIRHSVSKKAPTTVATQSSTSAPTAIKSKSDLQNTAQALNTSAAQLQSQLSTQQFNTSIQTVL